MPLSNSFLVRVFVIGLTISGWSSPPGTLEGCFEVRWLEYLAIVSARKYSTECLYRSFQLDCHSINQRQTNKLHCHCQSQRAYDFITKVIPTRPRVSQVALDGGFEKLANEVTL